MENHLLEQDYQEDLGELKLMGWQDPQEISKENALDYIVEHRINLLFDPDSSKWNLRGISDDYGMILVSSDSIVEGVREYARKVNKILKESL